MQRKRQQGQSSQQSNKKPHLGSAGVEGHQKPHVPQIQQESQKVATSIEEKPLCKECNKHHKGKCKLGTFRCFFCMEEEHKAGDRPKRNQPTTGRVFVMNAKEMESGTV